MTAPAAALEEVALVPAARGRTAARTIQLGSTEHPDVRTVTMTARALAAFIEYRNMGPGRSLRRLSEESKRRADLRRRYRLNTLEAWSSQHGWQELVRTFDTNLAAESAQRTYQRRLQEAENRREQRMATAALARAQGFEAVKSLKAADITPAAAVKLLVYAANVEREDSGDDLVLAAEPPNTATLISGITQERIQAFYDKLEPAAQVHFMEVLAKYQEAYDVLTELLGPASPP